MGMIRMKEMMIELRSFVERHKNNNGLSRRLSSMGGFSIIYYLSGLLLLVDVEKVLAGQVQNSIVGEPYISCAPDAIYVKWKTDKTFIGNVSVKYSPNKSCYQVLVTNNQVELLVPHIDCQVNRIRSINPAGIIIETSILISFHPHYITSGDRIYLLKCFHHRAHIPKRKNHLLSLSLDKGIPSIPTTNETSTKSTHLSCTYDILAYPDGPPITTVSIGDSIFHQWKCEHTKPEQCLLVNNCFLRTYDSQHPIIDENGCSVDRNIVPELEYMEKVKIGQKIQVFGVQQRPEVQFQCQLTLVNRKNGSCPRPICEDSSDEKARSRRDLATFINQQGTEVLDVVSQQMEILPLGSTPHTNCRETTRIEKLLPEGTVCVSKLSFGIVAISTLAVAICTLVVVLISMYRRFHYRDVRLTAD
uniref:ZP domain-containing protein n=1 Tax=Acrobeloides nanus TaxID=290746 RepID=A0A914CND2_9BILA